MKQASGPLSEEGMLQSMLQAVAQLAWVHLQACVRRIAGIGTLARLRGTSPEVA